MSWAKKNPEENRKRSKKWYYENTQRGKDTSFWSTVNRRYGVSKDTWQEMFELQNGCCAICGTHQSNLKKRLAVDHCHKTGKVRSLLCYSCNGGLGMFKDNLNNLLNAVEYLRSN